MHLKSLQIRNLRALEDISISFDESVAVIVGPNAIGKSTILQAIRLARALLAPRTGSEAQQVLIQLGAINPSAPQQVNHASLARTSTEPVVVECEYTLTHEEIARVRAGIPQLAINLTQQRIGQAFGGATNLAAFFSSEAGQTALSEANKALVAALDQIDQTRACRLNLVMNPTTGRISGQFEVEQTFLAFLEQSLPPYKTIFSYFPADRAWPSSEAPFQLGANDVAQQLETYNSQPQTKYNRLRNTVFSAKLRGESLDDDFESIFRKVLLGRRFGEVKLNQNGSLNITIVDTASGRSFDLDHMSSGEKGLILTFLIISQTMANGGMILLDEPELHLNPAATRKLLSFLIEEYVKPKNLQAIVCTHSPEILADAFERTDSCLYHLKSPTLIERVRKTDYQEVNAALERLGTSTVDGLIYDSELFVEGDDDVRLLHVGFDRLLSRFNIKGLGGRGEVEKTITALQIEESNGNLDHNLYFIFDHDNKAAKLQSTPRIRILQWKRYCIENYLLDFGVISDILIEFDTDVRKSPGELEQLFRQFAMKQLNDLIAQEVYNELGYENPGLRSAETRGKSFEDVGFILFGRLSKLQGQLGTLDEASWIAKFTQECQARFLLRSDAWSREWQSRASGKRLFADFQAVVQLKRPLQVVKSRIMERMLLAESSTWREVKAELQQSLLLT